jgi:hypothetical protein
MLYPTILSEKEVGASAPTSFSLNYFFVEIRCVVTIFIYHTCTPRVVACAIRYPIVDGDYYTGESLHLNGGAYM